MGALPDCHLRGFCSSQCLLDFNVDCVLLQPPTTSTTTTGGGGGGVTPGPDGLFVPIATTATGAGTTGVGTTGAGTTGAGTTGAGTTGAGTTGAGNGKVEDDDNSNTSIGQGTDSAKLLVPGLSNASLIGIIIAAALCCCIVLAILIALLVRRTRADKQKAEAAHAPSDDAEFKSARFEREDDTSPYAHAAELLSRQSDYASSVTEIKVRPESTYGQLTSSEVGATSTTET